MFLIKWTKHGKYYGNDTNPPVEFDKSQLPALNPAQIVFWDETHRKQFIGDFGIGGTMKKWSFPRDTNGKLSAEHGEYAKSPTYMNTKYPGECRIMLGCAAVEKLDGTVVGLRCELYFYSGKLILSIKDWNAKVSHEIQRIQKLKGRSSIWCKLGGVDHRKAKKPYESLYGTEWQFKIRGVLSSHICITDLVDHIVYESSRIIKGTKFKENWMFYHDALKQLTSADCVQYMKDNGILENIEMIDLN